tara:strand:- start:768 stop:1346 length:579 start_codon:yes stop_codon:yes gene_type:complete
MSKTPFRILKLKSGEDIVAQLVQNKKETITVDRPMVIKVMHYVEPMSGMKKESLVLYDWLRACIPNKATIEKSHILSIFDADPEILKVYEIQKKLDDESKKGFSIDTKPPNTIMKMPKNMGGIDNLLKAVQDQLSNKEDMINKIESDMESFIDEVMDDLEEGDADIEIVKDEDRGSGESYTDWSPNPEDYLT